MRKSDQALIAAKPKLWAIALQAATLALRNDTRFLGATKLREKTAEIGALMALSGQARQIGKAGLEKMSAENVNLYTDGLHAAKTAAHDAILNEATK